ncbi:uncharacterized protein LOC119218994 [Tachysurus ichikawai]
MKRTGTVTSLLCCLFLYLLPPTAGRKISPSDAVDKMVHFHKTTVYNIDVTTTDESPRVCELRAKLLNDI